MSNRKVSNLSNASKKSSGNSHSTLNSQQINHDSKLSLNNSLDVDKIDLPGYDKIKSVGQGSFGVAVLYRRKRDHNLVVMKQIHLANLTASEKELAMNEVDVFSKLHHPNIICYLGSFIRGDILLIEMEYADAGTLAQIIGQKSPNDFIPERQVLQLFEQITSAICYMHSENILHRDLKTANVFLNTRGTVKLGDFGISKMMSTNVHANTVLGTPYYFSPEMCEGKDYDTKSDIWALGCVLGEICCLQKAFAATNLSDLVAKIMSAQYLALPSGYSEGLRTLMKILLQVSPINRPTAAEVLQYWIPLVYRSIGRNKGHDYNSTDSVSYKSMDHSPRSIDETGQYIEASTTATLIGPRVERSVLYEMKSVGNTNVITPLQLPPTIRISSVATNGYHFLAVTVDGLVYSWGEGNAGQLGNSITELWKHYPRKQIFLNNHRATAGDEFSIFWTDLGIVLSCGDNSKGCLGHENILSCHEPKIIGALSATNSVFTWGTSHNGALGLGNHTSFCPIPQRVHSMLLNKEIDSIFAAIDCSVLLLKNGDVLACGRNTENRLGFGRKIAKCHSYKKVIEITKKVKDVSLSSSHSILLVEGGYVVTLGKNTNGQRGLGHCRSVEIPSLVTGIKDKFITKVSCSSTYSVVFSDENILTLWGTRSGIPSEEDNRNGKNEISPIQKKNENVDFGSSTAAFTNFLASVYKPELILEPNDVLALFSSPQQLAKGYYIKFSNIYPLQHSILILVDTTTPLGANE